MFSPKNPYVPHKKGHLSNENYELGQNQSEHVDPLCDKIRASR